MLKFYIDILNYLTIFAFLLGVLFAFLISKKDILLYIIVGIILILGSISTIVMVIFKQLYPQKMVKISLLYNRRALAIGMIFMLLSLLIELVKLILKKRKEEKIYTIVFSASLICITSAICFTGFTIFPQVYALTKEFVAFGESSFGTQSLLRLGGYLLGIIIIILIGISVQKIYFKLERKKASIFSFLVLIIATIDFFLRGIAALARLRILKSNNEFVFKIMIFEDKSNIYIIGLFASLSIIISLYLFFNSIKVIGTFKNNAMLRKEKAKLKNNRNWAMTMIFFSTINFLAVTVIHSHINKPVALTPPQPYHEEGNLIIIPLTDVEDGHLHRFSYISTTENNVRFIIVKKPKGGSYGVGLDACDICGLAGYYERNDEVVCKRCDVVMNKSTIGFKGGCNPVPFEYEIKDKKIIIDKAVLEREKDRFPVGD